MTTPTTRSGGVVGTERVVDVDGPLRLVEFGDGPTTFVCVHGLGGSTLDWQLLAPRLATRGRVIAFDLPGFGDSPLGHRSATVPGLRQLTDQLLRRHGGGGGVVLVGNSLGGMVAMLQAAARPSSVSALILLSPVLPASIRHLPHVLTVAQFTAYAVPSVGEWFLRTRRRSFDPRAMVEANMRYVAAHPERIPGAVYEQRAALARRVAGRTDADRAFLTAARSLLLLAGGSSGFKRAISRIATPTLVLHGRRDRLVSVRAAHALRAVRPDWSIQLLDDIGHVPQLEAPDTVVGAIDTWLDAQVDGFAEVN